MLKISSGYSEKNRISFYTIVSGVTAIRNKNNSITIEFGKERRSVQIFLFSIFSMFSLLKTFLIVPLIENKIIGTAWYLIPTFFYIFITIKSIIMVRKTDGKDFLRNHAAEHMVASAYEKLKRIPTIKEANRFSRIRNDCGITIYSAFITSQLIGFFLYAYANYMIPEIILFLVPLFFSTAFPFNIIGKLAQLFTTAKPKARNIELAIAALSALEQQENF